MTFINNLNIGKRIAIALTISVAGIMFLALWIYQTNHANYVQANSLGKAFTAVDNMSEIIHVMQIERGRTAAYIGGGLGDPSDALVEIRGQVDEKIAQFDELTEALRSLGSDYINTELDKIKGRLTEIAPFRDEVATGAIKGGQNLEFYSGIIMEMFELLFATKEFKSDATIAVQLISLLDISETKEFAGQERGLVAGLIARGAVLPPQMTKMIQLGAKQDTLLQNAIDNTPPAKKEEFLAKLEASGSEQVDGLRQRIINSGGNLMLSGITGEQWFETTTARINQLRQLEKDIAADVLTQAEQIAQDSKMAIYVSSGTGAFIAIFAILAGFVVTRSITKPVADMTATMTTLASGDNTVDIPALKRGDELGQMAQAVLKFKEGSIERAAMRKNNEERKKVEEEERASRVAKDADYASKVRFAVDSVAEAMRRFADGDLTTRIDEEFIEELDELRVDFNETVAKMNTTLVQISNSAASIDKKAADIRDSADSLSKRTEGQAASLEETAAALEEITSTVGQTSDRSEEAAHLAAQAKGDSEKSSEVVATAVTAMERIENASNEISKIISVIDEIAFQTNLLALNAGVEAARAGDAGSGFAVVAQEVRELAQRSATAAKEINDLISKSNNEVVSGVKYVKDTGTSLELIASHVENINEKIGSISTAAREQLTGVKEVNVAVADMDQITQKNAAMVEESTNVTFELANEVENLSRMIATFRLNESSEDYSTSAAA